MASRIFVLALGLGLLGPAALRADLLCDVPVVQMGTVRTGAVLRATFQVRNAGNAVIQVRDVKTGCGCIQARLDATDLAPGQQARVAVEIHTVTQAAGFNRWGVTLRHSAGETRLEVNAQLERDITLEPAAVVLHIDRAACHTFRLTEAREQPLTLQGVTTSSPHVEATAHVASRQEGRWQREVTLQVKVSCPAGRHEGVVCVYTTDPACPELRVPFTIVKQQRGAVPIAPSAVEQVASYPGQLPARIVLLGRGEGEPVVVDRVEPGHPAIRCTFCEGPGVRSTLRVVVDASKLPPGPFEGGITVHLRQPAGARVEVPVRITR
ncbi:MAG: DUF1573 domain-containing protein [Gemmataceae bacterium]